MKKEQPQTQEQPKPLPHPSEGGSYMLDPDAGTLTRVGEAPDNTRRRMGVDPKKNSQATSE